MKRDKDNIDKTITNYFSVDKAPSEFTNHLMQQINDEVLEEHKFVQKVLKNHQHAVPNSNFAEHVLNRIEKSQEATSFQPVLGKKAWLAFAFLCTVIVFFALNSGPKIESQHSWASSLTSLTGSWQIPLPQILHSPILALSLLAIGLLLMVDFMINNRLELRVSP